MKNATKIKHWERVAKEFKNGSRKNVRLTSKDRPMTKVSSQSGWQPIPDYVIESIPAEVMAKAKADINRYGCYGNGDEIVN